MNLKEILTNQKKTPEPEHFLALEIHESLIKTAVWKTTNNEPSIVSIGSFELWDSEESLVSLPLQVMRKQNFPRARNTPRLKSTKQPPMTSRAKSISIGRFLAPVS